MHRMYARQERTLCAESILLLVQTLFRESLCYLWYSFMCFSYCRQSPVYLGKLK